MLNLSVKCWKEQVCVHYKCQSCSHGQFLCWYYWFFVLWGFLMWLLDFFFNGQFFYGRKYSSKCRFLPFLSDWQTKFIYACKDFNSNNLCLIFWTRMVSQLPSTIMFSQENNFFNYTTFLFLSDWRKLYSQSSPQNIFVLLMIWHLGTVFNTKLCRKLPRWVFEKHLVSCSAFRVFKPMQFLSAWEVKEHFFPGAAPLSPP